MLTEINKHQVWLDSCIFLRIPAWFILDCVCRMRLRRQQNYSSTFTFDAHQNISQQLMYVYILQVHTHTHTHTHTHMTNDKWINEIWRPLYYFSTCMLYLHTRVVSSNHMETQEYLVFDLIFQQIQCTLFTMQSFVHSFTRIGYTIS